MRAAPLIEHVARRQRIAALAAVALVAITGLWATLHLGDRLMMTSPSGPGWLAYSLLLFLMWWTMMMAMMLPSAAPAILTYGAVARRQSAAAPLWLFAAGYAVIWSIFSALAAALQLWAASHLPFSMMMALTSSLAGGVLLLAAGLYQLTPFKSACLRKCQSPLMYLGMNWQPGRLGALRMGVSHGLYCFGCCWVLMGLLFYGGVMELRWIIGLALYVAAEKLIPAGSRLSHATGLLLVAWGGWTLFSTLS